LAVETDLSRGAEIISIARPGRANVLAYYDWETPLAASRSTSYGSDEFDWLSAYRGGWQELLANAGDACVVDGVPLPFHGEVSTAEWQVVRSDVDRLVVRTGTRLPIVVERRMIVAEDAPVLTLEETVTNVGPVDVPFLWGHHPVFAARPGMVIDAPPGEIRGADTGEMPSAVPAGLFEGLYYLPDRDPGWVALRDPAGGESSAMAWDASTFRHLWAWFELEGAGFPWYGRARMVGLEPQAAWPRDGLANAIARGRNLALAPGESRSAWLTLTVFDGGSRPVIGVERDGSIAFDQSLAGRPQST
jgi:hypothetical protein